MLVDAELDMAVEDDVDDVDVDAVLGDADLLFAVEEDEDELDVLSNEERDLAIHALDMPAKPDEMTLAGLVDRLMSLSWIGEVIREGEVTFVDADERPPLLELLLL